MMNRPSENQSVQDGPQHQDGALHLYELLQHISSRVDALYEYFGLGNDNPVAPRTVVSKAVWGNYQPTRSQSISRTSVISGMIQELLVHCLIFYEITCRVLHICIFFFSHRMTARLKKTPSVLSQDIHKPSSAVLLILQCKSVSLVSTATR